MDGRQGRSKNPLVRTPHMRVGTVHPLYVCMYVRLLASRQAGTASHFFAPTALPHIHTYLLGYTTDTETDIHCHQYGWREKKNEKKGGVQCLTAYLLCLLAHSPVRSS